MPKWIFFFVLLTTHSFASSWHCEGTAARPFSLTLSKEARRGRVIISQRIETAPGVIPEGLYEGEIQLAQPAGRFVLWIDVSKEIPDFRHRHHDYTNATLRIHFDEATGRAVLLVEMAARDWDLNGTTLFSRSLNCTPLKP